MPRLCEATTACIDVNELTLGTTVSLPPGQVSFSNSVQRLHIETVVNSLGVFGDRNE